MVLSEVFSNPKKTLKLLNELEWREYDYYYGRIQLLIGDSDLVEAKL